jgi:hypothetical protein
MCDSERYIRTFIQNGMPPSLTVFYSTKCSHCKELLEFIIKHDLKANFNAICIDNKRREEIPMVIDRVPTIYDNNTILTDEKLFEFVAAMVREKDVDPFEHMLGGNSRSMTGTCYSSVEQDSSPSRVGGSGNGYFLDLSLGEDESRIYTPEDDQGEQKSDNANKPVNLDDLISRRENDIKVLSEKPKMVHI